MIDLMLCVRNKHGRFTGYAEAASLYDGDSFCELHGPWRDRFPAVEYEKHKGKLRSIQLLGLRIPVYRHGTHVGNILWDSYDITKEDGNRLLAAMRDSELFDMVNGTLDFWAAWREPERVKRTEAGRLVF